MIKEPTKILKDRRFAESSILRRRSSNSWIRKFQRSLSEVIRSNKTSTCRGDCRDKLFRSKAVLSRAGIGAYPIICRLNKSVIKGLICSEILYSGSRVRATPSKLAKVLAHKPKFAGRRTWLLRAASKTS